MGQTIVEKIAEYHLSETPPERPVREGDFVSIWPRHVLTHDNTFAVMKKFATLGRPKVRAPRQPVIALDHDIQNRSPENLAKYQAIEAFARDQGIDFYPAETGIGHQIMVENGYALPGAFVVASDSHANMYGALGAIGSPVVRTDAATIWATGEFWWQVPRTVQVVLEGKLPRWASGKDVILTLCGLYHRAEVLNAAVEFTGPGVASLSMDARITIANMTTEWGALTGWFPVDEITVRYLVVRRRILEKRGVHRISEGDIEEFRRDPIRPDPDAAYAARITLDLDCVSPRVAGPDTVQAVVSVEEIEKRRVHIQRAYLLSCVNSRLQDLQEAAEVLRGRKVAPGVKFYVAAASREVQDAAEASGAWNDLMEAGGQALPPGCGPCIGLGEGLLAAGEVGISATNRNFKGRMGSREATCYLGSPAVVAASAATGYIVGPEQWPRHTLEPQFELLPRPMRDAEESVEIIEGFPVKVKGRLVYMPPDNMNTDGIYGKDYTYREDMTREAMARVVMENYDPEFAGGTRAGDIPVGGANFGTGSSREQAATSLMAKGFPVLVAASFSQTYLRNAFNNGFPCIECPDLVARLREQFRREIETREKTVIPGDEIEVDFSAGLIRWRGERFPFPPLSRVAQALVVAGGVENLLRQGAGAL